MSLTRPRRKPIFHRAKNPWPSRMRGLALAGLALAALVSFRVAAVGFDDEAGVDPQGVMLGAYAEAAQAQ